MWHRLVSTQEAGRQRNLVVALQAFLPHRDREQKGNMEKTPLLMLKSIKQKPAVLGVERGIIWRIRQVSSEVQPPEGSYVGVLTSPAGPWPSACPITAVSRGLNPTLSKGIPKANNFASYVRNRSL